jgi:UDP-N-acetylglucosamine 4,6-dehydratase/5-epimerase
MKYRIREVSERLDVPVSTLRFWEKAFCDQLKPHRTEGGQRRYSDADVRFLLHIKALLKDRSYTIAEVKRVIAGEAAPTSIADSWEGKVVVVTGGTGTFGRRFCDHLLKHHNPAAVRVFSRDEGKHYAMMQKYDDDRLRNFIGNVRDVDRLRRAMDGADVVVHAAAQKQVPLCEYNPFEATKTNIQGTQNVIEAALDMGVAKVIGISTDKAVNPVNLYGATKLCSEKLLIHGNAYAGGDRCKFSVVRYGNVLGSRGSVVPLFLEQKSKGKLTITDTRMTRFWITLDQAVAMVINVLDRMHGGEIFVPKIPSMKVSELARAIAPGCELTVIGIRPGEKLDETLVTAEDARHTVEYDDMYVIYPPCAWQPRPSTADGAPVPEGFVYSSETNTEWLTGGALRRLITEFLSINETEGSRAAL